MVAEGRTLLLPCGRAPKPKQRWFHRRKSGRREAIFTRYKNGTAKAEGAGSRLSFQSNALQIQDLQPEDAGEYHCNGELQGRVTVITGGLVGFNWSSVYDVTNIQRLCCDFMCNLNLHQVFISLF